MNELNKPFDVGYHDLGETGADLSRVPFGKLIGNIMTACVDAQESAANAAWNYTRNVLEQKDPIVFTYLDGKKPKKIAVPLITIVPLPYLSLENVDIDFDAEVSVDNRHTSQFLVNVNNESAVSETVQTARSSANMHIAINATTSDMPAGLAMLLNHIGGGITVIDVPKPPPASKEDVAGIVSSLLTDIDKNIADIFTATTQAVVNYDPCRDKTDPFLARTVLSIRTNSAALSAKYPKPVHEKSAKPFADNGDKIIDNSGSYRGGEVAAAHVIWTRPRVLSGSNQYTPDDFDILSIVLSALLWRKFNGPISLYTDTVGYNYYISQMGMRRLWNGDVDTKALSNIPGSVPADVFWNAGKPYAIQKIIDSKKKKSIAMLSTDMLVWGSIYPYTGEKKVVAYYPENLENNEAVYPAFENLSKSKSYKPSGNWDWNQRPFNTALTYYKKPDLAASYANCSKSFMSGNTADSSEKVAHMAFADQRMFGLCNGDVPTFLTHAEETGKPFTLLWDSRDIVLNGQISPAKLESERLVMCKELSDAIRQHFSAITMPDSVQAILDKYE